MSAGGWYRTKPVTVRAIQFNGVNVEEIGVFLAYEFDGDGPCDSLLIETFEGDARVFIGDWIIQGAAGDVYTCGKDEFEGHYEPAEER